MCFPRWQCTNGNIQLKFYEFTLVLLRVSFINLFEQTNITVFIHSESYYFTSENFIIKVHTIITVFSILLLILSTFGLPLCRWVVCCCLICLSCSGLFALFMTLVRAFMSPWSLKRSQNCFDCPCSFPLK